MATEPLRPGSGRKYRSKKQRPCDLCRTRKVQCRIHGNDVLCELCQKLDRRCTFVLEPLRKGYLHRGRDTHMVPQQTNGPLFDEGREESRNVGMPRLDSNDLGMDIDVTSLLATHDQHQTFDQLVPAQLSQSDRALIGFHLNTMTDGNDQLQIEHPGENYDEYLPNTHALPHSSYRVPPTYNSVRSHSSASLSDGLADGQDGDAAMDTAFDNLSQCSADVRNVMDVRQGTLNSSDWPVEFSLDSRDGYSNQLIGLSSESDPFLLRHYPYDIHDNYPMFRLDFRKIMDDIRMQLYTNNTFHDRHNPPAGYVPVQFMMTNENIWQDDLKAAEEIVSGNRTEKDDLESLNKLVPPDLSLRLLKLYFKFVHPRFPVLSFSDIQQTRDPDCRSGIPIGIKGAIYALAAPFSFLDDELSVSKGYVQLPTEELWAIAYRSFYRAIRLSHLSLLQLCLLLLQMPPRNFAVAESPSPWALSCSALAIAESLGLNLDPSSWRLPRKEVMLRRRLWWLTYVQHVWHSLVFGRPSHLNDDNWDVSKLTSEDFEGEVHVDPDIRSTILQYIPIVLALCDLSMIAADVLSALYTLKAVRDSSSLPALLRRAKPLRTRIERWRQSLPLLSKAASDLTEDELEQSAALRLSHLTLEILIFRALLRPLVYQAMPASEQSREPDSTIFENCYTCAKVGTELVSALKAKHFASFWSPYVRYQLCYISSFALMTFAQSITREMAIRNYALLSKWRDTLRAQARVWPLARLATMRLDASFWKGLSVIVQSLGPESPAVLLAKEQESQVPREA